MGSDIQNIDKTYKRRNEKYIIMFKADFNVPIKKEINEFLIIRELFPNEMLKLVFDCQKVALESVKRYPNYLYLNRLVAIFYFIKIKY